MRDRIDERIASRLDDRLVARLVGSGGTSRQLARRAAFALAGCVHLTALAVTTAGVLLAVSGDNVVQRVIGAVLLLPVVLLVLPRRSDEQLDVVDPDAAPEFTAFVGRVAAVLGTPPPTLVAFTEDINAYAARRGLRERRLVIGAPLWAALGPQARIALVGHELGHFSHRDVVHGRWTSWAVGTLTVWLDLVTPDGLVSTSGRTPLFATIVSIPIRLPLLGARELMWKVQAAASRHEELRADTAASAAAGTDGSVEALEAMLLIDVIDVAANRAAVDPARPDLAQEIRTRMAAVSPTARRALPASDDRSSVDRTHPRTVDRLRLQESLPAAAPAIALDASTWEAIDAELRPATESALKRMADSYRYVW